MSIFFLKIKKKKTINSSDFCYYYKFYIFRFTNDCSKMISFVVLNQYMGSMIVMTCCIFSLFIVSIYYDMKFKFCCLQITLNF